MKTIFDKFLRFWYLRIANPVVAKGEKGGFKWRFRRFTLELTTVSGNWSMQFIAGEHPYAYLLESIKQGNEENVYGYAVMLYSLGCVLTKDQKVVNDVQKALRQYDGRLQKAESKKERDDDDIALKEVEMAEEYAKGKRKPGKAKREDER